MSKACWLILLLLSMVGLTACEGGRAALLDEKSTQIRELDQAATRLYKEGRYAEALPYVAEIVALLEAEVGPGDLKLAQPLNNLAVIHERLGHPEQAEILYLRVVEIIEKEAGPDRRVVAGKLAGLAAIQAERGNFDRSEALYRRVLAIYDQDEKIGPDHPLTVQAWLGLAEVNILAGRTGEGESLFEKTVRMAEASLGSDHPLTVLAVKKLADARSGPGRGDSAEKLYIEALAAVKAGFYDEAPATALAHYNLARYYVRQGAYDKAHVHLTPALASYRELPELLLGFTSRVRRREFLKSFRQPLDLLLQLVADGKIDGPDAIREATDAWLRLKGMDMDSERRLWAALMVGSGPEGGDLFRRYLLLQTDLSRLSAAGSAPKNGPAFREKLEALARSRDEARGRLEEVSPRFKQAGSFFETKAEDVGKALSPGTVLVDFIRVEAPQGVEGIFTERYMAFVYSPGGEGGPSLIDIGPAEPIEELAFRFVTSAGRGEYGAEAGRYLSESLLAPLMPSMVGADTIVFSPDGRLDFFPLESLVGADGRSLLEHFAIVYVQSVRELLEKKEYSGNGRLLFIGAPDFGSAAGGAGDAHLPGMEGPGVEMSPVGPDRRLGERYFRPADADDEAAAVEKTRPADTVDVFIGAEARESVLTGLASPPEVLHISTYFFSAARVGEETGPGTLESCGLVFAGADWAALNRPGPEDGLLTAAEILGLRLTGVRLVVLSLWPATGDRPAGSLENLGLLIRAFRQAGARQVMLNPLPMSNGNRTAWLAGFYEAWKKPGTSTARALQRTTVARKWNGTAGWFISIGPP